MTEQLEEQRNNFLLDVWAAMRRNQVVVIIVYNSEENDYFIMSNKHCTDFDETVKTFCELPFLGKISPQDTFEDWGEYFDDVALAEIYGFELEDGMVQIAILDSLIKPLDEIEIHEACCNEKLTSRLFDDYYNGDIVDGEFISLACAMRWLRDVREILMYV